MKNNIFYIFIIILFFFMIGCEKKENEKPSLPDNPIPIDEEGSEPKECEHILSDWLEDDPNSPCWEEYSMHKECLICGEWLETKDMGLREHDYVITEIDATCQREGRTIWTCNRCDFYMERTTPKIAHILGEYEVVGKHSIYVDVERTCTMCHQGFDTITVLNNTFYNHGKLSVVGRDLVDAKGEPFQLYGLSTHGLQWFGGSIINYDVFNNLSKSFTNNVIRLSLYTGENGYCESTGSRKEQLKQMVIDGVNYATSLGLYVIIDWHMLGANDDNDKNPLYYLDEAKAFFSEMSLLFKDNINVLYEIMNEPNGKTTWSDCKKYALEVIPLIRENTDAIILVGNPRWTSDLSSVIKDPITEYDNLMYTYHFYAADAKETSQVINAYNKNIPVFISEFGFMGSDGSGSLNYTSGNNWLKVLNERNISYVAWNISNSKGTSSILKQGTLNYADFSDENLKEWGVFLKNHYRQKSGIAE